MTGSAGGGGGTKGPAVVDKRGQEAKCPYCDKVYTQVPYLIQEGWGSCRAAAAPRIFIPLSCVTQSGRLKEHITSKHADEDQGSGAGASSSSSAAAPGKAAAAAAAGRPPAPASARPPPSHPAAAALVAAAAAAAADTAAPPKRPGSSAPPAPTAAASPSGSSSVSIMDVGSKAGYYTHKSPKLQLLEWAQSKKMAKPRYSARQQEGGVFTCKVNR